MAAANEFPRGTVTFFFTDIEGSTALWERNRDVMRQAVDRHISLLDDAIAESGGVHFKTVGDALQAAFHTAPDALLAAVNGQRALLAELWPEEIGPLRVRMALHAGTAQPEGGDYLAPALNRLARTLGIGHGGQILVTEAARGLLVGDMPEGVGLRSLGDHALRGLQEPEEVFQIVATGLHHDFPPLRSLAQHPTNLAASPTPLIGRDNELAAVTRLLSADGVRLVTLTGPGGSGKTRLALEVGAEVLDAFAGGVFFVDLSALRDPALLIPTIASTFGLRETPGETILERLVAFFVQRTALLLLDNFEQVVDAAGDVAALLAASPTLRVLVTSREPLRIRAEREIPIAPLAIPTATAEPVPLETMNQIPAVALFVARATASNPGFALTDENVAAVAEISRRLDGLPLAIELAAARTRLLTPSALLARLDKSLAVLTGGARDLPVRQRTLRDTIAWSHELLDEAERTLFRRLAVFVGGWELEAAETVVGPVDGLDVLGGMERLIEQSLVRFDDRGSDPRYAMLETIREFAAEQLAASGEEPLLREAHAAYVLALAEADAGPPLPGNLPDNVWEARLDRNQDNVRAALTWLLAEGEASRAVRLAVAGARFWSWRGLWTEGHAWLTRVLPLAAESDSALRASAIAYAGSMARSQGNFREAIALLSSGLDLPQTPESASWRMLTELRLAQAYSQMREFDQATAHFERALELATALRDQPSAREIRWSMAYTANSQGDITRAREIAEAVLVDARRDGEPLVVAATLELVAWIALSANDLDTAAAKVAESWRTVGEQALVRPEGIRINLWVDEAVLAYRRNDLARSAEFVGKWLPRARAARALQRLLIALLIYAGIASRIGRSADAARWFGTLHAALKASEHGMHLEPAIRPWHEADIARVQTELGQEAFDQAWEAGARLPLDRVLSEAEETMERFLGLPGGAPTAIVVGATAGTGEAT